MNCIPGPCFTISVGKSFIKKKNPSQVELEIWNSTSLMYVVIIAEPREVSQIVTHKIYVTYVSLT